MDNTYDIHKGVGYKDIDIAVLWTPKANYKEMPWFEKCDIEYINSNINMYR